VTMLENVLAGMRDEINELKTAINFEANRG
jgi:hypothetical protein